MEKVKAKELLENEQVRRWYENLRARSPISADIRLRSLAYYCNENHVSPMEIVEQAKAEDQLLKRNFEDFVRRKEKEGLAGSYISKFKTLLKSWLEYNNITYPLKVNIEGENDSPTTMDEKIPLKEELNAILRHASLRGRVAISIMAFSGCRPEVLGNYEGTDGLTLKDLEDLDMKTLKFTKTPSRIIVRSTLSKAKHQYFTFIGQEGQKYIEEYLLSRMNEKEDLSHDSPLLQIDLRGQFMNVEKNGERLKLRKSGHRFLRTMLVTRDIREAMRSAGFDMRPYVLRAYFITQLDIAENKRLISHPWRLFFEGHKGDISARYSVNKGRLPPDMIEEMRNAYQKCLPYLETVKNGMSEEELKQKFEEQQKALDRQFREQLLMMVGFTKEEIESQNLLEKTTEEIQKIVRDKLSGSLLKPEDIDRQIQRDKVELSKKVNGARQKIIPISLLEKYMQADFEFMAMLGNDKAIIRLP